MTNGSVLRTAQSERRWLEQDLSMHRRTCLPCSRLDQPDCAAGAMLVAHLDRATRQVALLKQPPAGQLDLLAMCDD